MPGALTATTHPWQGFGLLPLPLAWPPDHIGWRLEMQTNSRAMGVSTNWATVPGFATTNLLSIPISPVASAFFRLVYP